NEEENLMKRPSSHAESLVRFLLFLGSLLNRLPRHRGRCTVSWCRTPERRKCQHQPESGQPRRTLQRSKPAGLLGGLECIVPDAGRTTHSRPGSASAVELALRRRAAPAALNCLAARASASSAAKPWAPPAGPRFARPRLTPPSTSPRRFSLPRAPSKAN